MAALAAGTVTVLNGSVSCENACETNAVPKVNKTMRLVKVSRIFFIVFSLWQTFAATEGKGVCQIRGW
jgi:hypothetical protein